MRLAAVVAVLVVLTHGTVDASPAATPRCGTAERLPQLASRPRPAATAQPVLAGEKLTRDGFGGGFTTKLTSNFAIKWRDASVTEAEAQLVADALETAWRTYVDDLGHDCTGCGTYRVNAYIARSSDSPSIEFLGGYAWIDDDGFPFFVISRDLFRLAEAPTHVEAIAAHELYHVVQFSTGAYEWGKAEHGWFWEATAEWAAQQALPESAKPYIFVGAFALGSELSLYHYGDPLGGDGISGVHQYAASIFFRHATDSLGDPGLVVDAWTQASADSEPLDVFARQLPSGTDLPGLYGEVAARTAIWDFPRRAFLLESVAAYAELYPDHDPIAARVPPEGAAMATLSRAPHGYGYAVIEIARPASGQFAVEARISPATGATLQGTIVHGEPGGASYTPLAITDGSHGSASVRLPDGVDVAYLVVSTITSEHVAGPPIPLAFSVTPIDGDDGGGCHAGAGRGGSWWLVAVVGALCLARRRRCETRPRRG